MRVAVIAVGGIRQRAHYRALLWGLALPIVLSGLLDWITWGWPFHSTIMYIYYQSKVSSVAGLNPVYSYIGWEAVAWGLFGVVIVLSALYGALRLPLLFWVAATIFVVHSLVGHKEYRYISPALPLIMTLAGVGSTMAADWLADRLGRPQVRRALMVAVPLRLDGCFAGSRGLAKPDLVLGPITRLDPGDARVRRRSPSLRRRHLSRQVLVALGRLREFASGNSTL